MAREKGLAERRSTARLRRQERRLRHQAASGELDPAGLARWTAVRSELRSRGIEVPDQ